MDNIFEYIVIVIFVFSFFASLKKKKEEEQNKQTANNTDQKNYEKSNINDKPNKQKKANKEPYEKKGYKNLNLPNNHYVEKSVPTAINNQTESNNKNIWIHNADDAKKAIVFSEIFSKPKSLKR